MSDLSNSRNVKIVWALRIGTGRVFHKAAWAGYGESSHPVLVIGEQKSIEFVEHTYFEHFG